ncbi:MAG TPA: class II aldolase/adducin family protein [Candidatus Obscuribacterales bacterium]
MEESFARRQLIEVCRLAYSRGYICGTEGNFSMRLADERIVSTPRGTCKARIEPEELVLTDLDGKVIEAGRSGAAVNARMPSTELSMHLAAYHARPDVKAVVHAHPTVTVAFTVAGVSLSKCILPETVCTLGVIPVAPYATPSTEEVPASIEQLIGAHDAVVLDHHGALTVGSDLWDAFYKLETLEHHAQTLLVAHLLGGPKPLLSSQVKKLLDIRSVYGFTRPLPVNMLTSPECSEPDQETPA